MYDQPISADVRELLRKAYAGFNARDIEAVLSMMHPDVEWPNGMEGGYVYGHDGVRAYWTRQWRLIDPFVEPQAFRSEPDGRILVEVHQRVLDKDGGTLLEGRGSTSTASETDSSGTWKYAIPARTLGPKFHDFRNSQECPFYVVG